MCKFCDLQALDTTNFDSFFQGATTHGYKSMVCKNCSTTYLTTFVLIENESPEKIPSSLREAEEKDLVLLPR